MFYFYTPLNILNMKKLYTLNPVATYENPDIQKKQIYSDNKGKAGIYR